MKCPHCDSARSKILETRGPRRRHLCSGCAKRYTSVSGQVFVDLKRVGLRNLKQARHE